MHSSNMDSILAVYGFLYFMTCSVPQVQGVGFHLPDPESFTYSCTSIGSWSVTGNVTLTEGDLDYFSTNMTLTVGGRNLCNIDLATCPELDTSAPSTTANTSPNVCKCIGRFSEDDYSIYVRHETSSADVGAMLTIIVPGQDKFSSLKATHDIGRIPIKTDGNITYQINSGLPALLAPEQNITACKGQPLSIKVCAPDAHKETVLQIKELRQTVSSTDPCVHIIEAFTFQNTDSYPVVFSYDEGAGCPFQEPRVFNVYQQMNGCTSSTLIGPSSSSSSSTPAPTTAPYLPCPESPTSPGRQAVTLSNGIKALCDTWTTGGNWLVIQRRSHGDVDFYRGWSDYVAGFGDLDGDHWMGLQDIHTLCPPSKPCSLRVDLKDDNSNSNAGVTGWAEYSSFSVGGYTEHYQLSVSGYNDSSSTLLDSLTNHHDGAPFSTYDRDNDKGTTINCALTEHGAWWYDVPNCHTSNLNGMWGDNSTAGLYWKTGWKYSPKPVDATYSEMKVRLHP